MTKKKTISTHKELTKALGDDEECIEIDGDLATRTFRIHAAGNMAWVFCLGATGAAALLALSPAAPVLGGASAILGRRAVMRAIALAVAAGGVSTLNKMRKYKAKKLPNGNVVFNKKAKTAKKTKNKSAEQAK